MTFSSSFLQLDGIEFKLSDSLQTVTVQGLSPDFKMRDPSRLLLESEYDFSKEKSILKKIETMREAERKMAEQEEKRKQLSLKRKADAEKQKMEEMMLQQREVLLRQRELFLEQKRRQKDEAENEPEAANPSEETSKASSTSPTYENVETLPPPIPPRNPFSQVGKDLLTPQPAARKTQDPSSSSSSPSRPNQSQPVVSGQDQIWVDFEDKELDPFTNMELKTIDDIAELQTVLQNATLEPPPDSDLKNHLPTYEEVTTGKVDTEEIKNIAESVSTTRDETPSPQTSGNSSSEAEQIEAQENLLSTTSEQSQTSTLTTGQNGLYENVSINEVKAVAKKLVTPQPPKPQTIESVYEFASDPPVELPTSVGKNIKRNPSGVPDTDPTALYTAVRPRLRASKTSPDLSSNTTSQSATNPIQTNQVKSSTVLSNTVQPQTNPFISNQKAVNQVNFRPPNPISSNPLRSNPATPSANKPIPITTTYNQPATFVGGSPGSHSPVLPRTTRFQPDISGSSPTGRVTHTFPPPAQINPTVTPKVLPISFGVSPATQVLPPVNSALPDPTSTGSSAPTKPPVPPRDPIKPSPGPSQPITASQNGPAPGHSHLFPPYALPRANGQSTSPPVALKPVLPKKPSPAPCNEDTSFVHKSHNERAKFTATVNKALSSLPQNPKPIPRQKPAAETSGAVNQHQQPRVSKTRNLSLKSSLVAGLSSEEQEFVRKCTSMGFDLEATVRATQKYGMDDKEVIDHLINVQRIVEQGFSSRMVQDALDLFQNDKKAVAVYLQQANQLIDMGFKEEDVRDALKSNNNDQTKALDQLMGQS